MTPDQERAARLTGAVWAALNAAGGPRAAAFTHFPAVLDPAFLAALPIPTAGHLPPGQAAAMPSPDGTAFHRHAGPALTAAYASRRRTRIIEDIGWDDRTPWAALTGRHLTRLTGTGSPRVTITVYQSAAGDQELSTHSDTWTGAVIQADGAKTWHAGPAPGSAGDYGGRQITLTAGDILIIPKHHPHQAATPPDPGRSLHLLFAIDRDLTTTA